MDVDVNKHRLHPACTSDDHTEKHLGCFAETTPLTTILGRLRFTQKFFVLSASLTAI